MEIILNKLETELIELLSSWCSRCGTWSATSNYFYNLLDLLPEVASSSIFSQEGLRPRHSAAAASSASTCCGSSESSGSSWCHSSRNCVHTLDVAMKNFRELDNNSYVTTTKTSGEEIENIVGHLPCMTLIYVHDCWRCGKPKTINPPFEDGLYHPFRVLPLDWTHCNPLSQHHQPVFNDNIILETLGLHSAWSSIRQQRKCDDERLGVDTWQLRFCEMLHLLSILVYLTIAKVKDLDRGKRRLCHQKLDYYHYGCCRCSLVYHPKSRFNIEHERNHTWSGDKTW